MEDACIVFCRMDRKKFARGTKAKGRVFLHEQRHGMENSKTNVGTEAVSYCGRVTFKAESGRL